MNTKNNKTKNKKFKIKFPSAISIIIGVLFFAIILSWIIHLVDPSVNWFSSQEQGLQAVDDKWFNFNDSNWYISNDGMYGIFDSIKAVLAGMLDSFDIIFFIFAIGALIELLIETDVLKTSINSIILGLKNKKLLLVPLNFIIFSIWGTLIGTQEATLSLMPVLVPAFILIGFDSTTGFLVILAGATTGIAASVLEPFALGNLAKSFDEVWQAAASDPSSSGYVGGSIGLGTGIDLRIVLFIVYTTIGCIFVTWYGNRVIKKGKTVEEPSRITKNKIWAEGILKDDTDSPKKLNKAQKLSLIFVLITFLVMVIVLLPWSSWIPGIEEKAWWQFFSHLFFFNSVIGHWTFFQLSILFSLGWFFSAKAFKYNKKQMKRNWKNSVQTFSTVAYILIFSRATSIVLSYSGDASYLANNFFNSLTKGDLSSPILSLLTFPLYLIMAIFIPSMTGLSGITAPIIAPIVSGYGTQKEMLPAIIGIMSFYPLAQGVINMTSPTTGLVVAQAEASNSNYSRILPYLVAYGAIISFFGVVLITISTSFIF